MMYSPFNKHYNLAVNVVANNQVLYTATKKSLVTYKHIGATSSGTAEIQHITGSLHTQKMATIDSTGAFDDVLSGAITLEIGEALTNVGSILYTGTLNIYEID